MTCHMCKGCGAYDRLQCSHWGPCDCDARTVECEACEGSGEVPPDDSEETDHGDNIEA